MALSVGSNLGNRMGFLRRGIEGLSKTVEPRSVSSVYETEPVGAAFEGQPAFLNAVLIGDTVASPAELLREAHAVEAALGRDRKAAQAPRTLDVDLIFHGDEIIDRPALQVPHPRWSERGFVLVPMLEVAPDWVDPVSGRTVMEVWIAFGARPDGTTKLAPSTALWRMTR